MAYRRTWFSIPIVLFATSLAVAGCGTAPPGGSGGDGGDPGTGATATGGTGGTGGTTCTPAEEICDGKDNNCDGTTDEGCDCSPGETQPCYEGPAGTEGVGPCKAGTQPCTPEGTFGACEGSVTPTTESCNNADDDCDGSADEELGMKSCGVGLCMVSVPACEGGVEQACTPGTPQNEVCNGQDDDCDALVDEADPQVGTPCMTGVPGNCSIGGFTCMMGVLTCMQSVLPVVEQCNNQDDDCDGTVDNGDPGGGGTCATGLPGVCSAGTETCQGGSVQCVQNQMASAELCDALDNDCDGTVNEGNPGGGAACMTGMPGICSAGTMTCTNGALSCKQNLMPGTEVCDALDNDCDGMVNEGNPGGGAACSTGLQGICAAGTTACTGGMIVCNQNQMAGNEVCGDMLDNDCDGTVNEGCGGSPGIIYMTSSNGTAGFYALNLTTNMWSTLPNPPSVTYTQITTDGTKVLLLGSNNTIYTYTPATQVWATLQTGPGSEASSPIGFLKWTPQGIYYVKDFTTALKRSVGGGAWITFTLPAQASCAGTFDSATNRLYIRQASTFGLMIYSTTSNTLLNHFINNSGVGENSRTGAFLGGFFYVRDFSGPFFRIDVSNGMATNTNITPAEQHTATDVDAAAGKIYIGPYSPTGTVMQSYTPATNMLANLPSSPVSVSNHSTIVLIK